MRHQNGCSSEEVANLVIGLEFVLKELAEAAAAIILSSQSFFDSTFDHSLFRHVWLTQIFLGSLYHL